MLSSLTIENIEESISNAFIDNVFEQFGELLKKSSISYYTINKEKRGRTKLELESVEAAAIAVEYANGILIAGIQLKVKQDEEFTDVSALEQMIYNLDEYQKTMQKLDGKIVVTQKTLEMLVQRPEVTNSITQALAYNTHGHSEADIIIKDSSSGVLRRLIHQNHKNAQESPSTSSEMSHSPDSDEHSHMMMMMQQQQQNMNRFQSPLQQLNIDSSANISAGPLSEHKHESWQECITVTNYKDYTGFLFSVYVGERAERKFDEWTYFDCLHRLQSKCPYRLRSKKQDEFYIVEEKGVHNHGAVEPVGQAGSHAGLPKTIREIVDRSYNENWSLEDRTVKVDEEIRRLGLPANPRLGHQIDNRVAYLRRVKNLNESRRITDHVNGTFSDPSALQAAMLDPNMLQAPMDQNGGKLTVEKGMVEQLLGPQTVADLVSKQEGEKQQEFLKPIQSESSQSESSQSESGVPSAIPSEPTTTTGSTTGSSCVAPTTHDGR